jgi:TolA-binding protein
VNRELPRFAAAACAAAVLLAVTLAPRVSPAATAADLSARARQIASDIAAQDSAGRFDVRAQQAAIERLGQLSLAFIDVSEQAARAGTENRDKDALLQAYEAIRKPLDQVYERNSGKLERLARAVMDVDGDLEALYESPEWKEAQLVASQALYFRNWLHYYGARLQSGAQRKEQLEKAERGFSEFAIGDRRTPLLIESLLGRALCHLELGNYDWAIRDFQLVVEEGETSSERRAKARLGLLDAYARSGKVQETIRLSDSLLASQTGDSSLIRYYRARALLNAAKDASGSQADRYRRDALDALEQLRRAGSGWQEKADALMQAEIENPEQWAAPAGSPAAKWSVAKLLVQKGDYEAARPLLQAIVASSDAASKRVLAEAHYLLGLAVFQHGDYRPAADHFAASLQGPTPSYAADASYMRFKSLEAVAASNPDGDPQGYEIAIRDYLSQHSDHRAAHEARYRLGEWLQAQRRFPEALAEYEQVRGDPGFEFRARFGALQCRFEILSDGSRLGAEERQRMIAAIGADLERFDAMATEQEGKKDKNAADLADLRAKVAIMIAVHASLVSEPRDQQTLAALSGFEEKYPEHQDLFPQVARLRLGALQRLGRFDQAEAEVERRSDALRAGGRSDAIETLAQSFQREAVRRKLEGDEATGKAAERVASRLYELLLTEAEGSHKTKLTLARLYESSGEVDKAAALYQEIVEADGNSLSALRGLARITESSNQLAGALDLWQRVGKLSRPGDFAWYEASYEIARLTLASGRKSDSCSQLEQLKPAMPGLSDAELRAKLSDLYQRACD